MTNEGLLWGKGLETIGALLLAYVAVRAAWIEIFIVQPLRGATKGGTISPLTERLEKIFEAKRREFGLYESIFVSIGTLLIFSGCLIYFCVLTRE